MEGPDSTLFVWDADLIRTAHRLHIPYLDQDMLCPCAAKFSTVYETMLQSAHVLETGTADTMRCPTSSLRKPALKQRKQGSSNFDCSRQCVDCRRKRQSLGLRGELLPLFSVLEPRARRRPRRRTWHIMRPQTDVPRHSQPMSPERPPLHPSGLRRTRQRLGTRPAISPPGSPNGSAPPPIARPTTSSLRNSTVIPRLPFCNVSAWLPRETPSCLWHQATGGRPGMTPRLRRVDDRP